MKKIIQIQIVKPVVKKTDFANNNNGNDNHNDNGTVEQHAAVVAHDHRHEIAIVNETFLGGTGEAHIKYNALISKKRTGYKQQDVANKIYDPRWFVTNDEITELLVASKLKCFYCRTNCWINYTEPHCSNQWTLDRISNDQGHNRRNVVIACLKCNLDRGTKSSDRFKLGKQFTFVKI
jgi:5-methylcytosine-specific restriction endonuclease McrA